MKKSIFDRVARLVLLVSVAGGVSLAQQGPSTAPPAGASTEDLQKATQNPVASLISVPIQDNINLGVGPYNRTQNVLNIQPVIPTKLNDNWNLIIRVIQPIVWQPYPTQPTGGEYGLGDMNPTLFCRQASRER